MEKITSTPDNNILTRVISEPWKKATVYLAFVYLLYLIYIGYSGGFYSYSKGAELEVIIQKILFTLPALVSIFYVIVLYRSKSYIVGIILLGLSLVPLLLGFFYYGLAVFNNPLAPFRGVYYLFSSFFFIQLWFILQAISMQAKKKWLSYSSFIFFVLLMIMLISSHPAAWLLRIGGPLRGLYGT